MADGYKKTAEKTVSTQSQVSEKLVTFAPNRVSNADKDRPV